MLQDLQNDWQTTDDVSWSWQQACSRLTLLRSEVGDPELEPIDSLDILRSASSFGAIGIAGVVLSPKALCV